MTDELRDNERDDTLETAVWEICKLLSEQNELLERQNAILTARNTMLGV